MAFVSTLSHAQILWVVVGMQCLIFGSVWLIAARMPNYLRDDAGSIACFNIALACSALFIGIRGQLPDQFAVAVPVMNVLCLLAFVCLWQGVTGLDDQLVRVRQRTPQVMAVFGLTSVLVLASGWIPGWQVYRFMVLYVGLAMLVLVIWDASRIFLARMFGKGIAWLASFMAWALAVALMAWGVGGLVNGSTLDLNRTTLATLAFSYLVLALVTLLNSLLAFVFAQRALFRLEDLGRRDTLTELLNRRGFNEELARVWTAWQRHGHAFSVACCDIDHFKGVNDRFGHQAGDDVLVRVAQSLVRHIRPSDRLARTGGEEFVLLLAHAPTPELEALANRLREAVAADVVTPDGAPVHLSVGLACSLPADEHADAVVSRADAALYRAKDRGRNRVELADELLSYQPGC